MSNPLHNAVTSAPPRHGNIDGVYRHLAGELRASGVATPELDARLLICHACALSHERFAATPAREVTEDEIERIRLSAKRRCAREPVSRILGSREFWGLEFEIGPQILDPRPDTETLVSAGLELVRERRSAEPLSILDLGTGSGCILISLLHELDFACGVGTDISAEALELARVNAKRHGVAERALFVCTSWCDGLGTPSNSEAVGQINKSSNSEAVGQINKSSKAQAAGQKKRYFDLVLANPPYIPTGDLAGLEPEVARYDPRAALDGGRDGLDAYRKIANELHAVLAPGGWALFETGEGQGEDVSEILRDSSGSAFFDKARQWHDLAGHTRCVAGKRSPTR